MNDDVKKMVSRRSFVGAAVAATGVAAGILAAATGCAPQLRSELSDTGSLPEQWDEEHEIVVAGSGTAMFGALRGAMQGMDVVVLEKGNMIGGTTSLSGMGMYFPMNPLMGEDDREEAVLAMKEQAETTSSDELVEAYVDGSEQYPRWIIDELGIELAPASINWPQGDYYQTVEHYRPDRAMGISHEWMEEHASAEDDNGGQGGGTCFRYLREKADEVGMEYRTRCEVVRLLQDENGRVVGVQADDNGSLINIKATKGVLLGVGSFDHNEEMKRAFLRCPIFNTLAVPTNTGDGIRMGLEVGADLAQMQSVWGMAHQRPVDRICDPFEDFTNDLTMRDAASSQRMYPGCIIVNRYGVRFGNESAVYHTFNRTFEGWDAGSDHNSQMWPGYIIVDGGFLEHYAFPRATDPGQLPEGAVQADSLEELAELCGIDFENLQWQVNLFNQFAEDGVDRQFHRGEANWDLKNLEYSGIERPELKNPCLAPLTKPPYAAMAIYPGALTVKGGLRTNGNAQVLDRDGNVIEGLYASGGGANSPFGEGYAAMGACVGTGIIMSCIACDHMGASE